MWDLRGEKTTGGRRGFDLVPSFLNQKRREFSPQGISELSNREKIVKEIRSQRIGQKERMF